MSKVIKFVKKEAVLFISMAAALISMIFTPPNPEYLGYVDWSTLGLLFCLMAAVQGFGSIGAFSRLAGTLTRRFHSTRSLGAALVLMCFFLAMLVTNDVSVCIRTVVLETAAANLGSMATPMGNPQNLYIYSHFSMPVADFFRVTLPPTALSLALLLLSVLIIPRSKLSAPEGPENDPDVPACASGNRTKLRAALFSAAAAVSLCTVLRLLDWRICLVVVLVCVLTADWRVLRRVDYALLLTFICFFVFVGNLSAVPAVRELISGVVSGREMLVGVLLSQVISNVPCAVMLSGFTGNAEQLLLGVDIGGLGTLIASLASLISFKLYGATAGAKKGRYFAEFSAYNFAMLIVLFAAQTGFNALSA